MSTTFCKQCKAPTKGYIYCFSCYSQIKRIVRGRDSVTPRKIMDTQGDAYCPATGRTI